LQNAWFLSRTDSKPSAWMATVANGNDLIAHMLPLETYEQVYQSGPT